MHPSATILMARSHQADLRRAAARSARRGETRRAAEGTNPRRAERNLLVEPSMFRRLAARFAI